MGNFHISLDSSFVSSIHYVVTKGVTMTVTWYHETKEAPDFDARISICDEDGTWDYMSEIEALEEENKKLKAEIQKIKEASK